MVTGLSDYKKRRRRKKTKKEAAKYQSKDKKLESPIALPSTASNDPILLLTPPKSSGKLHLESMSESLQVETVHDWSDSGINNDDFVDYDTNYSVDQEDSSAEETEKQNQGSNLNEATKEKETPGLTLQDSTLPLSKKATGRYSLLSPDTGHVPVYSPSPLAKRNVDNSSARLQMILNSGPPVTPTRPLDNGIHDDFAQRNRVEQLRSSIQRLRQRRSLPPAIRKPQKAAPWSGQEWYRLQEAIAPLYLENSDDLNSLPSIPSYILSEFANFTPDEISNRALSLARYQRRRQINHQREIERAKKQQQEQQSEEQSRKE